MRVEGNPSTLFMQTSVRVDVLGNLNAKTAVPTAADLQELVTIASEMHRPSLEMPKPGEGQPEPQPEPQPEDEEFLPAEPGKKDGGKDGGKDGKEVTEKESDKGKDASDAPTNFSDLSRPEGIITQFEEAGNPRTELLVLSGDRLIM